MANKNPPIGHLRWLVTLAKRQQVPSGDNTITESLVDIMQVHADIQTLGPMLWLAGEQTARPITNRIYVRWLDWLDQTYVITRQSLRTDQTLRTEVFRIRKIGEYDGRKRFLEILAELEDRA